MGHQSEREFLKKVFEKSNLSILFMQEKALGNLTNIEKKEEIFDNSGLFLRILPTLLPRRLYKFSDGFERHYYALRMPDGDAEYLLIGPYLCESISSQQLLNLSEKNGISPQKYQYLLEYYMGLPVLSENSPLFIMLNTFCEKIWNSPAFTIVDLTKPEKTAPPFSKSMRNLEVNDMLVNKQAIERRYAFENQLIRAVALGQVHLENQLKGAFSLEFFEKRSADPLRNAKNYAIIMNTLLRKGAEQGGVHPIYLDQTSSEFANQIESLSSLSKAPALMLEIFRSYCRLVRKHSLQKFPLIVQKTILMIDADLSANLSPKLLASSQGVTLGYLSTIFKKETGKTLSEYICERRMEYAEYLLRSTNLQIQTIALHCGVMDAQYFSKLFKKYKGLTPMQYRHSPNTI